jgi:DNA-binding transcriptional ArsR family regulator
MLKYQVDADVVFHALADPSRRLMIERLSRGPATVSELAAPLPMSLPSAVQHLGVLEASGLVRTQKVGRVRTCQLEPKAMLTAEDWMAARRLDWERRLDRLGDYLAAQPDPVGEPPPRSADLPGRDVHESKRRKS